MQPLYPDEARLFTPMGWNVYKKNPARYVGSTNMTDIYVDTTLPEPGLILVNGGDGDDSDWHWAKIDHALKRIASCGHPDFDHADIPSVWFRRFMEDRENIEAYLRCFVPEFSGALT